MSTVVAAVDSSPVAARVLAEAKLVASVEGAAVDAVHVVEPSDAGTVATAETSVPVRQIRGEVVEALLDAASPQDVVDVVVGARGTVAGPRPLGHVALELLGRVHKPILVVPPGRRPALLKRMLVALDGTDAAASALRRTIELASRAAIEVVALHIHEPRAMPMFSDQPQHETRAWADEFLARYCGSPPAKVALEVRAGYAWEHVVDVADELDANLIALAWSGDLSPGRAEVVRYTLQASDVPVLLVPVLLVPVLLVPVHRADEEEEP